jgi:hypothetical protein
MSMETRSGMLKIHIEQFGESIGGIRRAIQPFQRGPWTSGEMYRWAGRAGLGWSPS